MSITLAEYQARFQRLVNDRTSSIWVGNEQIDLINQARSQVAADSKQCRFLATVETVLNQEVYPYSGVTGQPTGYAEVLFVRSIAQDWSGTNAGYGQGSEIPVLFKRDWTWLQTQARAAGYGPNTQQWFWAPYGLGASGAVYFFPIPDAGINTYWDCVCDVTALSSGGTEAAIPYPWTDAVAFYAAWLALSGMRGFVAEAADKFQQYEMVMRKAREITDSAFSTPG